MNYSNFLGRHALWCSAIGRPVRVRVHRLGVTFGLRLTRLSITSGAAGRGPSLPTLPTTADAAVLARLLLS